MARRNKDIQNNVKQLIADYPGLASNYNLLVVQYWLTFDNLQYWHEVEKATPSESITRAFRKLKNEDDVIVDAAVENARLLQKQQFQIDYSPYLH